MALLEKHLIVRRSGLPNAGKGLFTRTSIAKGSLVVEYKGKVTTWKEIESSKKFNGYVFYINRNLVIDAQSSEKWLGRYANDAKGLNKIKSKQNNCCYAIIDKRVFIKATKNIEAGEELFVGYGKEYWDVVRYNKRLKHK
ncbi:MAG: SET domain-containing protein-lysine N-methyltransferase [Parafilimonas sp.]|nr:SET domain-containing protein-lysine N-methyltransferase [Parafilimonas sp.]